MTTPNQFAAEYEWRGDFDYTPTDFEKDMIEDAIIAWQELDDRERYPQVINDLSANIHQRNIRAGWWTDIKTGATLLGKDENGRDRRNVPELLMLVVSEVAEAMEGYRKNLQDDKLPDRSMFEVELADVFIRIFDIAGAHNLDLGGAIYEKLNYNANREDHKIENRMKSNGKKF